MKTPNYVFDDELYHHGIPGQRWGFRRFQNEDGSWTPAGRERYGEGDGERIKIEKAKATYNTQKYKADLKSKAQKDKDVRAAKEERNRIRQQVKTEKFARREQAKLDRKQAKFDARLRDKDTASLKNKLVRTKRYAMSDEELSKAIDRLKLEVEYNKQYALASKPNSALARADRFFDGPTGKMVRDIAVQTIPGIASTTVSKLLDNKLKYSNDLDREKQQAEIEKTRSDMNLNIKKADYEIADRQASIDKTRSDIDLNTRKANVEMAEKRSNISKNYADIASKRNDIKISQLESNTRMELAKRLKNPDDILEFLNKNSGNKKKKK